MLYIRLLLVVSPVKIRPVTTSRNRRSYLHIGVFAIYQNYVGLENM